MKCPECKGKGYAKVYDPDAGDMRKFMCYGCRGTGNVEPDDQPKMSKEEWKETGLLVLVLIFLMVALIWYVTEILFK